jgi:hypothetical protein
MKIVLMVEGDTEAALKRHLKAFLDRRAQAAGRPRVRLETRDIVNIASHKFKRRVALESRKPAVTAVVGLIDVFPRFQNAAEAKTYLKESAGNHPKFYAHAAQFDVEAWLLPYWADICRRVGVQQAPLGSNPETVDHLKPPSYRLRELYQRAKPRPRKYVKTIEMSAILKGKDLTVSANQCPEFKALLNTLLTLSDLESLP